MSDVPSELLREIFLQLEAESLFQLRSVCKEWLRIIDDSSFIKAHANNQLYNHTLVVGNDSWAPLHSFSLDNVNFIMNGPQMIDAIPIKNPNPRPRLTNLSTSVAPCNGLILFTSKDMLVIQNPLTKEYHKLPKPNNDGYAYGFGYDSGSDDYKVVLIPPVLKTLIYSLKSNSWRTVEDSPCEVRQRKGALLDGVLYWISKYDRVIVALDLGTERYCQLPLPMPPVRDGRSNLDLHALDGCLICSLVHYRTSIFYGWVMKDNGVDKSWIKLFSLQYSILINPTQGLRLVAYLKRKHQVVLQHLATFLWFDVANNSIKKFSIHGRSGYYLFTNLSGKPYSTK